MKSKFTWNDSVQVKASYYALLHARGMASVVGIDDTSMRRGSYLAQFPEGFVYLVEFADGSSASVAETGLVLWWGGVER